MFINIGEGAMLLGVTVLSCFESPTTSRLMSVWRSFDILR
jgi:hypothetical protein